MGITLDDWGYWDDTCDFVQNATPQYLEDNLEASSITALELNLMIFVDASDQIVSSSMVDLETDEEILMPEALQTYLSEEFFSAYHAVTGTFQTILLLPEAPFLLAAHSILPTSLEGPACGTIVVGRYLDPELVDYLAELAQVDLTIYLADGPSGAGGGAQRVDARCPDSRARPRCPDSRGIRARGGCQRRADFDFGNDSAPRHLPPGPA
jgi:sensor domain CHASE-containing protein